MRRSFWREPPEQARLGSLWSEFGGKPRVSATDHALSMDDARLGRTIRVLRQRRGWRQADLGRRCGLSRSAVSDIERGRADRYTIASVRRLLRAMDADGELSVRWGAPGDLERLLDRDHALLVRTWAEMHRRHGWEVWPEASYSVYGERGRIDLLAFRPATGILEVAEMKTGIWDLQETLGRLDAKVRLARRVATERGWDVRAVVGALVIAEGRTARRRIAQHAVLFGAYEVRGRAARAFVRRPRGGVRGLLAFVSLPDSSHDRLRRAGQRSVRPPGP
jgi:transcriptional regulator with XRE-family HTH domain